MQRLNFYAQFPQFFSKLTEMEGLIKETSMDHSLVHLVKTRASQINGCAFCVDMHVKQAKIDGEKEIRLYHLAIWEESPLFSEKEKAALAWTEAVTRLSEGAISDQIYQDTRKHFSEKEIAELTSVIALINAWNRFAATFRSVPGSADKAFGLDKAGL
jgi:AhpD family alkylhydroperoxidase